MELNMGVRKLIYHCMGLKNKRLYSILLRKQIPNLQVQKGTVHTCRKHLRKELKNKKFSTGNNKNLFLVYKELKLHNYILRT